MWLLDIDDFAMALESVWEGKYKVLDRMRLGCAFKQVGEVDTLSEGEWSTQPMQDHTLTLEKNFRL